MKKNVFFVAAIFAALCLNSCDKNDPDNPIAGGSGKILLTTALPNATGMDGTVYMQLIDRKSTRLNSSHRSQSRMPSSA